MPKGNKVRKTFTFEGKRYEVYGDNELDALKKMINKQRDLTEHRVVYNGNMTVKEWTAKAIEIYKEDLHEDSLNNFKSIVNKNILNVIGDIPIKNIKEIHCKQVLNGLKGYSEHHVGHVFTALRFIFKKAVINHIIPEDPTADLKKPKGYEHERRSLTEKERTHFLKVAEEDERFLPFELMLYCGCRPIEARNAMGYDIKTIDGVPVLHIRGTKSKNADRQVPIPLDFYPKIKDTPKFQNICMRDCGKPHTRESLERLAKQLYRAMNISMGCKIYRNQLVGPLPLADDFVPYCLRHTFCTDLQKKKVDLRAASYLMGHSSIELTAKIYTHQDEETILEAAKLING